MLENTTARRNYLWAVLAMAAGFFVRIRNSSKGALNPEKLHRHIRRWVAQLSSATESARTRTSGLSPKISDLNTTLSDFEKTSRQTLKSALNDPKTKRNDFSSRLPKGVPGLGFARRHAATALMLCGAALLVYVSFQYAQMFWNQRELEHEWAQQQRQQQAQPLAKTSTVHAAPAVVKDDGLTRLSIPSIDFDAVVVEGSDHKALLLGPGHMEDTPDPGEPGNSVISGHRDTFFRHIHELEKGDEILVQRDGRTFHYEVTGKHIVQPDDVSVLDPTKDAELTLITCYPTYYIGPAPKRLVVTSKLVDSTGVTKSEASSTSPVQQLSQRAVAH
jgi:LPXTG-site transpeptidase (sortase) family protein